MRLFARWAWGVLAYDVAVVAWGAYVRATGAGAGCGRHWPTCNGEVLPRSPRVETLVELSHRVSSGGALLLTVGLCVAAFRIYPARHRVRRAAAAAVALMFAEALIGAGLVLFELVAHDASLRRALSMSLHLVNTFLLLASTALTAFWASGGGAPSWRGQRAISLALGAALAAMLVVGTTGAITALGDTLFPAASLLAGVAQDFAPNAHAFVRLRAIHPAVAATTAAGIVLVCGFVRGLRPGRAVRRLSQACAALAAAQVGLGLLDVVTRAPVTLQLAHLTLADAVWITLVLTAAASLAEAPSAKDSPSDSVGAQRGAFPAA
ncbi:MAG: COX15/CtaA family protein [Polyangiaceae bacterium]|nr:COX15/CtaA family protein [Polyangiaceae bacterium]